MRLGSVFQTVSLQFYLFRSTEASTIAHVVLRVVGKVLGLHERQDTVAASAILHFTDEMRQKTSVLRNERWSQTTKQ